MTRIFAALLFALTFALPAAAQGWTQYCNGEYGFCIDYPAAVFGEGVEAAGGEGITATSGDTAATLRAYGFNNGDELSLETVRDILLEEREGDEVTYKAIKDNWIVLSGYTGTGANRTVFYQRLEANRAGDRFSALELNYPEADRSLYDPLVKRLSLSLTAPAN